MNAWTRNKTSINRFLFFLFGLACSNVQAQKGVSYNEVPAQSFILLTDKLHDSWPVWAADNQTIYVVDFSAKGVTNIFALNIDSMTFVPDQNRLYVASYNSSATYKQVTFFEKGTVDSPVLSPDGKKMAFRKDGKYILELDLEKGRCDTLLNADNLMGAPPIDERISFDYSSDHTVLYVPGRDNGTTVEWNIQTKQTSAVLPYTFKPRSIVVHKNEIFLTFDDSVQVYDKKDLSLKESIEVKFTGTRIGRLDDESFVMTVPTPNGPASAIYNTVRQKPKMLMHSYDYEPVLSPDKTAIAFLSEGANGMVLCKLK